MSGQSGPAPTLNLPNALTTLRLMLVPVFLWLLLAEGGTNSGLRIGAGMIFVAASLTDYVDGALARKRGLVTTFGKVADPIADKALTGAALVGLSILGELSWWITVVIIVREVTVTWLRFSVIHDAVIPASRGGKAKTAAQMVAILLFLLPLGGWLLVARDVVMALAIVLTVVSGIDYATKAVAVRRAAELRREAFGDQSDAH